MTKKKSPIDLSKYMLDMAGSPLTYFEKQKARQWEEFLKKHFHDPSIRVMDLIFVTPTGREIQTSIRGITPNTVFGFLPEWGFEGSEGITIRWIERDLWYFSCKRSFWNSQSLLTLTSFLKQGCIDAMKNLLPKNKWGDLTKASIHMSITKDETILELKGLRKVTDCNQMVSYLLMSASIEGLTPTQTMRSDSYLVDGIAILIWDIPIETKQLAIIKKRWYRDTHAGFVYINPDTGNHWVSGNIVLDVPIFQTYTLVGIWYITPDNHLIVETEPEYSSVWDFTDDVNHYEVKQWLASWENWSPT